MHSAFAFSFKFGRGQVKLGFCSQCPSAVVWSGMLCGARGCGGCPAAAERLPEGFWGYSQLQAGRVMGDGWWPLPSPRRRGASDSFVESRSLNGGSRSASCTSIVRPCAMGRWWPEARRCTQYKSEGNCFRNVKTFSLALVRNRVACALSGSQRVLWYPLPMGH